MDGIREKRKVEFIGGKMDGIWMEVWMDGLIRVGEGGSVGGEGMLTEERAVAGGDHGGCTAPYALCDLQSLCACACEARGEVRCRE
jgi:hypothetical protein